MAERKATNKYYPPDWDPSKGSINKYVGQHPLRERARKLDQGILIVRFELPFNIWCNGCENPIGQGVRYNAEKKKVGNYHSTPILSFRMKCHLCDNWFEIRTDPKNTAYVVTEGARKKHEDFDAADAETISLDTQEELERRTADDFAKLEHARQDELKAHAGVTLLTRLQRLNDRQWADPYTLSQRLRRGFREQKKARVKEEAACQQLADRIGFRFKVLPENDQDRAAAASKVGSFGAGRQEVLQQRIARAKTRGLFDAQPPPLPTSSTTSSEMTHAIAPFSSSSSSSSSSSLSSSVLRNNDQRPSTGSTMEHLAQTVKANTRLKTDPFLASTSSKSFAGLVVKQANDTAAGAAAKSLQSTAVSATTPKTGGRLVSYTTDSDSE
ncbi:hypothetical protein DFQ26_005527 [Actinomortierella ambigua]|nr:hypothetical protein DFQ26_005527 [Actinomortierella ambigua]